MPLGHIEKKEKNLINTNRLLLAGIVLVVKGVHATNESLDIFAGDVLKKVVGNAGIQS